MAEEIIDDLDLLVDLDTLALVRQLIRRQARLERNIMGALEDLQAADANLATEVGAVLADVVDLQAKIADLTAQVGQGVDLAALQPTIDDINAQAQRIADALAPPAASPADVPPADVPPAEPPA